MDNERREPNEMDDLEEKLAGQQAVDSTPKEILADELQNELEEPVEKSDADAQVEAEERLTVPEQRWLDELKHRVKEWKHDTSKQPFNAQKAIRKLQIEDLSRDDIELFRLFRCLQKSPNSLYFKQKFGQKLRRQQQDTRVDVNSTSYQFTKVLDALHNAEQE